MVLRVSGKKGSCGHGIYPRELFWRIEQRDLKELYGKHELSFWERIKAWFRK